MSPPRSRLRPVLQWLKNDIESANHGCNSEALTLKRERKSISGSTTKSTGAQSLASKARATLNMKIKQVTTLLVGITSWRSLPQHGPVFRAVVVAALVVAVLAAGHVGGGVGSAGGGVGFGGSRFSGGVSNFAGAGSRFSSFGSPSSRQPVDDGRPNRSETPNIAHNRNAMPLPRVHRKQSRNAD